MTIDKNQLWVNPLFYDALSGEFTPPSDEQHRKHTLGRLAYACYTKGEHVINSESTPSYLDSFYIPSWAGHITVKADFDLDEEDPQTTALYGVLLRDRSERTLYVANQDSGVYIGTVEGGDLEFPLELGESLQQARVAVTSATQEFFDSAILL